MKSVTTKRRPNLRVVVEQAFPPSFWDLENQICDLDRAGRIAFLMAMHDAENKNEENYESLALYAIEQVERLAAELRRSFNDVCAGKAVQSHERHHERTKPGCGPGLAVGRSRPSC